MVLNCEHLEIKSETGCFGEVSVSCMGSHTCHKCQQHSKRLIFLEERIALVHVIISNIVFFVKEFNIIHAKFSGAILGINFFYCYINICS